MDRRMFFSSMAPLFFKPQINAKSKDDSYTVSIYNNVANGNNFIQNATLSIEGLVNLGPFTLISFKSVDNFFEPSVLKEENEMFIFNLGAPDNSDSAYVNQPSKCFVNVSGFDIENLTLAVRIYDHLGQKDTPLPSPTFRYSYRCENYYSDSPGLASNIKMISSLPINANLIDGFNTYLIPITAELKNLQIIFFDIKYELLQQGNSFFREGAFFGRFKPLSPQQCGDINKDGIVDENDLDTLGEYLVELRETLPCQNPE